MSLRCERCLKPAPCAAHPWAGQLDLRCPEDLEWYQGLTRVRRERWRKRLDLLVVLGTCAGVAFTISLAEGPLIIAQALAVMSIALMVVMGGAAVRLGVLGLPGWLRTRLQTRRRSRAIAHPDDDDWRETMSLLAGRRWYNRAILGLNIAVFAAMIGGLLAQYPEALESPARMVTLVMVAVFLTGGVLAGLVMARAMILSVGALAGLLVRGGGVAVRRLVSGSRKPEAGDLERGGARGWRLGAEVSGLGAGDSG